MSDWVDLVINPDDTCLGRTVLVDMSNQPTRLPAILAHTDNDTPVPSWKQVTRSVDSFNPEMISHVSRVVAGIDDEAEAVKVWDSWPGNVKRSVALLIDKIYHDGWLDSVGPIKGGPWDGGFFFSPAGNDYGELANVLDGKSGEDGAYTRCCLRAGLPAYLSGWNHPGWQIGWIENDTPFASLHVGVFKNGTAEVHLDLFNPIYTNGAPDKQVIKLRGFGSYNRKLFRLHRKWEGSRYGAMTRTSANFYHLMRGRVPLCF